MHSFQFMINKLPKEIVQALKDTQQNPKWHMEGSVYNHLWMMYDSIWKSNLNDNEKIILSVCDIFHDLGKIDTTKTVKDKEGNGKIISYNHENYAKDYLDKYLSLYDEWIKPFNKEIFYYICKEHMRMHLWENGDLSNPKKRKELEEHEYFNLLRKFSSFDHGYDKVPVLILTVGIPGSGKSSWIKENKFND